MSRPWFHLIDLVASTFARWRARAEDRFVAWAERSCERHGRSSQSVQ